MVRQVVQHLLQHQLYIKTEKCKFHSTMVSFLGFIISQGSVSKDPEKLRAVKEWPAPTSWKPLQRFIGFANFYRRFIKNFSSIASPLQALTSSKTWFCWREQADKAFTELKGRFTSAPVLILPDPKLQFVVDVSILTRPGEPFSSTGSIFIWLTDQDQRTLNPMPYPDFTAPNLHQKTLTTSFLPPA